MGGFECADFNTHTIPARRGKAWIVSGDKISLAASITATVLDENQRALSVESATVGVCFRAGYISFSFFTLAKKFL